MYIQITTRCNMECAHCCNSCGPKTGGHMSKATFLKALDLCEQYGESPFLGGGEPTVHPQFWEFFGAIMARYTRFDVGIGMVTNGKKTEDALALAALAKGGILSVELSQDSYHEDIADEVVKAFTKGNKRLGYGERDNDMRGIRSGADQTVYAQGRGVNISGAEEGCCCEEIVIDPEGRIWACGCKKVQYGTVDAPEIPAEHESGTCYGVMMEEKANV